MQYGKEKPPNPSVYGFAA